MRILLRLEPPAPRFPGLVQAGLDESQEHQRHQLNLEGPQDRLFGPRPAFLHAEALLVVTAGILLPKPGGTHLHYLGCRQVQSGGAQEPRLCVARHCHHEDVDGDRRSTHGPATLELLVVERPLPPIPPRPAPRPAPANPEDVGGQPSVVPTAEGGLWFLAEPAPNATAGHPLATR
jgi:hypothetical protein